MTAAYWLYAFLVVPLVEPSVTIVESITSAADLTPGRRPYEDLFPEGSWERDHPKVVLTEQGALFIKDYRAVDEQRLELKPCTLVFYAGGKDGGEPGRPVILQAPEGRNRSIRWRGKSDSG